MGGAPLYCLVSMALAPWTDEQWIDKFYRGVYKLLNKSKVALAGGDISHAGQFICDVMLFGEAASERQGAAALGSAAPAMCSTFPAPWEDGATNARSSLGWSSAASWWEWRRRAWTSATGSRSICTGFVRPHGSRRRTRQSAIAKRRDHRPSATRRRGLRTALHGAASRESPWHSDRQHYQGQAGCGAI